VSDAAHSRALLLGDDLGVYLAVARSLGRRGIAVDLVPAEDDHPGLASRYLAALRALPPYHEGAEAWVDALRKLMAREDYRLVIPSSDQGLLLLDRHADALGRDRLALANAEALAAFTDKTETRALAAPADVPVAEGTKIDAGVTSGSLIARLGLPVVLKPCRSYRVGERRTKDVARIVRTAGALDEALCGLPAGEWLAEAFFPGEGIGLSVVADRGRILLAGQHRRLATLHETGGSSIRTTEWIDPHLLGHAERLAGAVSLTGPAMFEFRRDPRSGAHILLEVNARFWGSLPLALAAGADFPALAWDVFTGRTPAPACPPRPGVTRTNMTGEFDRRTAALEAATGAAAKAGAAASLLAFLPQLAWRSGFDSWAADDPVPLRAERRALLARLGRRLPRFRRRATAAGAAASPA
jgi:predicted ATP-grasp superfamily ATP-dependent carboligase